MKKITPLIPVFLVLLLSSNVSAQPGSGSTVINATITGVMELNLSLQYPEIVIPEDYYFYENLTVFQSDSQNISVYLNKSDANNFMKFVNITDGGTYYQDDYNLSLPINTYENVTLRVYVPLGQGFDGGTYNIFIYTYSLNDSRSNTTTLKVHVNTTNPIDDIEILNIYPSSLYPGESLNVDISIHKIFPTETTDIQICYCINENPSYLCGPSYNNYGCSWKAISEWLNYTKTVTVNENPGEYYFIVAVKYPNVVNIKRANSPKFYVGSVYVPGPGIISAPQAKLIVTSPTYLEASPGERISFDVEIENTGNTNALNTSLNMYGIPEDWVSIMPHMQDIGAGKSKNHTVLISLPSTAFEQVYSLFLVAKSGSMESTKVITLTVATTLENTAKFLLEEAQSRKTKAEAIIEKAKEFGMDTTEPEKTMTSTDVVLDETKRLFESRNYKESIEKAKQAIEGYKFVINSVNEMIGEAYLLLLNEVVDELRKTENLTGEKDVIESMNDNINQSIILQREERIIEAYQILLEVKQLLDQLKGKIYFRWMVQIILIISTVIIAMIIVSTFIFYRKKTAGFIKRAGIEEHKRRLEHLFKKRVRPSVIYEERYRMRKIQRLIKKLRKRKSSY